MLNAQVEESLLDLVNRARDGAGGNLNTRMVDPLLPDFPDHVRTAAGQLTNHLRTTVQQCAQRAIADLAPIVDLNVRTIDDLQADAADARNLASATDELGEPPVPEPVAEDQLLYARQLTQHRGSRRALRLLGIVCLLVSGLAVGAEGTLVHLTLAAIFGGVAGVAEWMLPVQAVVITGGLLYLAHMSRRRGGANTDWRWLSRACLCLIALALAVLRAGIANDQAASTPTVESWGLFILLFLACVVLAVLGAAMAEHAWDLLNQAHTRWANPTSPVAALEAAVAGAVAEQHNKQAYERRRRRFHARVSERSRQLENELRRTHHDTRVMLEKEMRQVHRRLAPLVDYVAWQLACLKHDGEPPARNRSSPLRQRLSFPLMLFAAAVLGTSCGSNRDIVRERHILLDTSGSMPASVATQVRAQALAEVREWADNARSLDKLTIWWLTADGAAYPAEHTTLTMPIVGVPAYRERRRLTQEFERQVEGMFDQLPSRVQRTRLLESLLFIGTTASGKWSLSVYSDMQQDSEAWDQVQQHPDRFDDSTLVRRMLAICPKVEHPPVAVAIRGWPGLVTRHQAAIREYRHARDLFLTFLSQWAPGATVRVGTI